MSIHQRKPTGTPSRAGHALLAAAVAVMLPACAPEAADTADDRTGTEEQMAETAPDAMDETRETPMTDTSDGETAGEPAGETAAETTVQLSIRTSDTYGEYLVRGDGTPLYLFTVDTQGEASACYDECADAWPPVTGVAAPGTDVDAGLLGTITRDDGSVQATFNGWPLYEFSRDSGTQPTGQDIESFGGEWYLVGPDGREIHAESTDGMS